MNRIGQSDMNELDVKILRSARRTIAIQMNPDGSLTVRAPRGMSDRQIMEQIHKHETWIARARERVAARQECLQTEGRLSAQELEALAQEAAKLIPERVGYFAPQVGVTWGRITIRNQATRFGSCSGKGNLNFNVALMLAPREVLDYVVVHELCHRLQMNHSADFWAEVARVLPDYQVRRRWLREHGDRIIARCRAEAV